MEVKQEPAEIQDIKEITEEIEIVDCETKIKIEKQDTGYDNQSTTKLCSISDEEKAESFSEIQESESEFFQKEIQSGFFVESELLILSKTENFDDQPCTSKQARHEQIEKSKKRKTARKVIKKRRKKYSCRYCRKSFLSRMWRNEHAILHIKKIIMCSHCGRFFTHEKQFLGHYFCHLTKNELPSNIENEEQPTSKFHKIFKSVIYSLNSKGNMKPFKCDVCLTKFDTSVGLKNHSQLHESTKFYECEMCSKQYISKGRFKTHIAGHEETRTLSFCVNCFKQFKTKFGLHNRLQMLPCPEPSPCDMCFESYTDQQILIKPMAVLPQRKFLNCEICSKAFHTQLSFQRHVSLHETGRIFDCKFCPAKGFSIQSLRQHLLIHSDRPFQCDICPAKFTHNHHLNYHRTHVHNPEYYYCRLCPKKYKTKFNLKVHVLRHNRNNSNRSDLKCSVCSYICSSKSRLRRHLLSHKKFQCQVCFTRFGAFRSLNKHFVKNRVDDLSTCNVCSEPVISKCHKLVHKRGRYPKCDVCLKVFESQNALNEHTIEKHM